MKAIKDFISKLGGGKRGQDSAAAPAVDKTELAAKIRESELFANLPDKSISGMLEHMDTLQMQAGKEVISEGAEGDYYYLIVAGLTSVIRRQAGTHTVVAELGPGRSFGEEALISNAKRNATIKMKTDGVLMRLSKENFNDFVKEPLVTWLSPADAQRKVSSGAEWLDVRDHTDDGKGVARLRGAVAISLSDLRNSLTQLDKKRFYVCYCQNGRQSSTAAFLLMQWGHQVAVMRGGLQGLQRAGLMP